MRVGIVGGGVYGLAVAYFLGRFGDDDLRVVLYERGNLASESTGYSAGIVRHHYTNEVQIETAIRGREILQDFEAYTGSDGGFHQNGYLVLADPTNEAEFREIVDTQRAAGLDVTHVDPADLDSYLPGIDPEGVTLGAYEPTAGFADPYLVAMGFAEAAREHGVEIGTKTPVVDIHRDGDTVTGIQTEDGVDSVDFVVNAAGPWGGEVAEMVGVDVPLEWFESKIVVLEAEREYGPDLPTLADHSAKPDMYVKPEPGGDFLVGGIDRPRVDRSKGLAGVDNEHLRAVSHRLEQRLPAYDDARVADTWSGIITVTPDSHQIAGVPEGLSNFYNVLGGSGHGFKEAPAFGESIARWLLGREPTIDLEAYRLERFEEGAELHGVSSETYGGEDSDG